MLACEFHQTNNLYIIYTDELSYILYLKI